MFGFRKKDIVNQYRSPKIQLKKNLMLAVKFANRTDISKCICLIEECDRLVLKLSPIQQSKLSMNYVMISARNIVSLDPLVYNRFIDSFIDNLRNFILRVLNELS